MLAYIFRRLLLIVPTLLGIMVINFIIVQFAPGGPIEYLLAQLHGTVTDPTSRISGSSEQIPHGTGEDITSKYRGAQGLDPELILQLEKEFGFDKPLYERFIHMIDNYLL